ncbi:hypothetical protein BDL97_02G185600 [Sphagnum fallax]|nr:hypothetical protein BDL97_02G185600 [Sphagnum fallax]KAH8972255.1 hypothetical protein BDL97_02G185600 [Sphagnum fallax]KAH8972256.1 hypothetical protein BDL97_02G185600 [Sphagnum fallax]KAH8972257.1 hypothetical protein BDL97_02G185600 [Sphagnum fallax]
MVVQQLRLGLWMRYWAGLRLAPHVGTPSHVGKRMLQLASVGPQDHVVDLGCGDGRLLIAAKLYGAKCYGVELDPQLFEEAQRAVAQEGMGHLINIERRDAFSVDLSKASVVTLYLSVQGNSRLLPMLQQQLPPGARVVSFCWPFEALEPARVTQVDGINLYLYKFNGGNAS